MIARLIKLLVRDCGNTASPAVRRGYGQVCGFTGIALNALLFVGKLIAGLLSSSIAITADALNNLSDMGSSVITLIGFRLAGKKPDPGHPYGHGRMEYVSGLLVAVMILLMALELIRSSFAKIIAPEPISTSWLIVGILAASIAVKFYMFLYNRKYGKLIGSPAMMATSSDSLSDVIATSVVLLSTLVCHFWGLHIDGWCGLLVGLFILYSGFRTALETIGMILGRPPEKEYIERIEQLVTSTDGILGVHDIIVHDYGPGRVMISLHAEVPASGDLLEMHDLINDIEERLDEELSCQSVIHIDPVIENDPHSDKIKQLVIGLIELIDPRLRIHDFRVIKEPSFRKVIFDVVAPYDLHLTDEQLGERITKAVRKAKRDCLAVVRIDRE